MERAHQRPDEDEAMTRSNGDVSSASRDDVPEEYVANARAVVKQTLDGFLDHVDAWGEKTRELAERMLEAGVSNRARGRGLEGEDAIALNGDAREKIRIEDLVTCENALLSKSTMILAHLGGEVQRLNRVAHESIYPLLATLGERPDDGDAMSESELRRAFVSKLQPLQDVLLFMEQVRAVTCNLFTQLAVVYSTYTAYTPYQTVRLSWSFDILGRILAIGLGIDETVKSNKSLALALASFKRVVLLLHAKPEQFGMNEVDVVSLDSAISIVEKQLFTASFFTSLLDQLTATEQPDRFIKELAATTLELLEAAATRVNTKAERLSDKRTLLSCICLTLLHSRLVPDIPDRKLCSKAWEVHKSCVLVPVTSTTSVCPAKVLDSHLSLAAREWVSKDGGLQVMLSLRRQSLAALDETFPAKLQRLMKESVSWLAKFTAVPNIETSLSSTMNARIELFQEGLKLSNELRHYLQEVIHLHVSLDAPVTKRRVRLLSQGVELLQSTYDAFTQNTNLVLETQHVLKFLADRIVRMMVPARELLENTIASSTTASGWERLKSHISSGKGESNKQDVLSNVDIAVQVLSGPVTQKRLQILRLCMDAIRGAGILSHEDVELVSEFIELAETLCVYRKNVQDQCDTSFLFFTRELFPICLSQIYAKSNEAGRVIMLVNAFRSCETLLMRGGATNEEMAMFENYLESCLDREIIEPLCRDIETDLRLHLHSARIVGVAEFNPIKDGVRDLSSFTGLPPIRMLNRQIDIRSRVEIYLNRTFHNHTAIALHNWKSYIEMRNIAISKYGLRCSEIELPSQTLEQGLDVLELMRNIHVFVSRYNYNLNTQCFVEKISAAPDRKHLNTISIRHVANSIRTHGTGITHTTINFAYQYLAQHFQIFSQFLFDDHIRSALLKEARKVKAETKAKSDAIKTASKQAGFRAAVVEDKFEYPVERASRLVTDVRKLGLSPDGSSFIDQFRVLVTEIGNALGFVRMVRLGVMHYSTNAAKFVPSSNTTKLVGDENFDAEGLSGWTKTALKNLQNELEALSTSGTDGTDYFEVLVSVFSTELRNKSNDHLDSFYLILPALTWSAAEAIVASKDTLLRRGKDSQMSTFTDDGLALGIVYLLSVLNQHNAFDALRWFESITRHFDTERKRANEETSGSFGILGRSMDEKTKLQVKMDKIAALEREFIHLKHSLVAARNFVSF